MSRTEIPDSLISCKNVAKIIGVKSFISSEGYVNDLWLIIISTSQVTALISS